MLKKITLNFSILFLIIIAGGAVEIPDYDVYEMMYIYHNYYPNALYAVISDWFGYAGLSFNIFRLFWATLAIGLIFYVVKQLLGTKEQLYFVVFFILTQFCIETIQIRNFMIVALFTLSFYILLLNKRYSWLCYLFLMVCAAHIHQIAYAFLPLVMLPFLLKRKNTEWFIILFMLFCVLCSFNHDFVRFIVNVFPEGRMKTKLLIYLMHDKMRFGYILAFVLHSCFMIIILAYYRCIMVNRLNIFCNDIELSYLLNIILLANIYLMVSWPPISIDWNFFRFNRVITPINHMILLLAFKYIYPFLKLRKKIMIMLLLIVYLIIYMYICNFIPSPKLNLWSVIFMGDNWIVEN